MFTAIGQVADVCENRKFVGNFSSPLVQQLMNGTNIENFCNRIDLQILRSDLRAWSTLDVRDGRKGGKHQLKEVFQIIQFALKVGMDVLKSIMTLGFPEKITDLPVLLRDIAEDPVSLKLVDKLGAHEMLRGVRDIKKCEYLSLIFSRG